MSIYKEMLGEQFHRLHPILRSRYTIAPHTTFKATGVMTKIKGGPRWLSPFFLLATRWKFLFPEQGKNIPFRIVNKGQIGPNGEQQVVWERTFFFPKKTRYFNALMSLDPNGLVKDYLGEPSLFYSELFFLVTEEGSMQIESRKQRLVIGKLEVSLPELLKGNVLVKESYLEKLDAFSIHVLITNPILGTLFEYEGVFQADDL